MRVGNMLGNYASPKGHREGGWRRRIVEAGSEIRVRRGTSKCLGIPCSISPVSPSSSPITFFPVITHRQWTMIKSGTVG